MSSLEITTRISKCLGCHFCPQDKLNAAYFVGATSDEMPTTNLSLGDFYLMLNKVPKGVQIHFSGFSEPFLNPLCGEMIHLATVEGYRVHLYTTLLGLTEAQIYHLKFSAIDVIRLHVPDGKFLKIQKELWLRQLNLFLELKRSFTAMAMGPISGELADILGRKGIKVELPDMLSRGGNLWNPNPGNRKFKSCSMNRWHSNVLLPNGDVYSDCHDYGLTIKLGNLLREDYSVIHSAAEAWKGADHSADICSKCEWAVFE